MPIWSKNALFDKDLIPRLEERLVAPPSSAIPSGSSGAIPSGSSGAPPSAPSGAIPNAIPSGPPSAMPKNPLSKQIARPVVQAETKKMNPVPLPALNPLGVGGLLTSLMTGQSQAVLQSPTPAFQLESLLTTQAPEKKVRDPSQFDYEDEDDFIPKKLVSPVTDRPPKRPGSPLTKD